MASHKVDPVTASLLRDTDTPRDAKAVACILKSCGVDQYSPRVVNMLLEFLHGYVGDVLTDAQRLAAHAGRGEVAQDDVRLAIEVRLTRTFQSPPPRDLLLQLTAATNATPLPMPSEQPTAFQILPPEELCITGRNFQFK